MTHRDIDSLLGNRLGIVNQLALVTAEFGHEKEDEDLVNHLVNELFEADDLLDAALDEVFGAAFLREPKWPDTLYRPDISLSFGSLGKAESLSFLAAVNRYQPVFWQSDRLLSADSPSERQRMAEYFGCAVEKLCRTKSGSWTTR